MLGSVQYHNLQFHKSHYNKDYHNYWNWLQNYENPHFHLISKPLGKQHFVKAGNNYELLYNHLLLQFASS